MWDWWIDLGVWLVIEIEVTEILAFTNEVFTPLCSVGEGPVYLGLPQVVQIVNASIELGAIRNCLLW